MNEVYKTQYKPFVNRWGVRLDIIGMVFIFLPPVALILMGHMPDWTIVLATCISMMSLVMGAALTEPITYFPALGSAGIYMGFLSGNVSNMKVPAALAAQEAAEVESGTEEGEVVATVGISVSVVVNLVILTIGALFGTMIVGVLPESVTSAMNLLLPALFGSMLANAVVGKPKLALYVVPVAFVIKFAQNMGFLSFIPATALSALVPLVIVFGAMGIALFLFGKNVIK